MNKKTIYLKDYLPPAWLIPETELRVTLAPEDTQVEAILHCKRNPQSKEPNAAIVLNGERLQLERLALNGRDLAAREYGYAEGLLSIPVQADECTIASTVRINPAANLELDGLYRSAGNYCTQCEAEGFRKITFFPDRPDVMSVFTTTVIGEKTACPVLLANGNLREQGELAGGLHFATWHDPFPKPCYLFALVAGNLVALEDSFTTKSGRRVALAIYVEPRNTNKCGHVSPHVEQIQDIVEQTLIAANHFATMRAYAVYREQRSKLRQDRKTVVDVSASINEYLDQSDWRVNANANQGYSLGGLILNVSGKVTANYWLNHVYPPEIGAAHRDGSLHLHDLDMLSGYCAGWSLRMLLSEGFNGVPGKIEASPPKHMSSAVGQIVNFLGTLQNEWAGAQAFSSFDTYMAPFVRKDRFSRAPRWEAAQSWAARQARS